MSSSPAHTCRARWDGLFAYVLRRQAQGILLPDAELRAQFDLLTREQRVMLLEECQSIVVEGNVTDAWLDLSQQVHPL
jgi:hypothetical protein